MNDDAPSSRPRRQERPQEDEELDGGSDDSEDGSEIADDLDEDFESDTEADRKETPAQKRLRLAQQYLDSLKAAQEGEWTQYLLCPCTVVLALLRWQNLGYILIMIDDTFCTQNKLVSMLLIWNEI